MCRSFAGIGDDLYTLLACVPEIICTGLAVGCQTDDPHAPGDSTDRTLSDTFLRLLPSVGFTPTLQLGCQAYIVLDRDRAGTVRGGFPH